MTASVTEITGLSDWLTKIIKYEIIKGNEIWRFGLFLLVVLAAIATGRIVQFVTNSYAGRRAQKKGEGPLTLLIRAIPKLKGQWKL